MCGSSALEHDHDWPRSTDAGSFDAALVVRHFHDDGQVTAIQETAWSLRSIQQYDCRSLFGRTDMALTVTRSAGMLLLSVWLILTGLAGFVALPLPGVLMAAVALIAGLLILVGR
jgi:hypothetical protein